MANTYPFSDPIGISKDAAQSLGLEAIDHRRGQGALSLPMYGNTFGTQSGVFPGGTSGAGISNDLQCVATSGLTATFNAGHYAIDRGVGNLYLGMAYAGWSVTLDQGDAVNPRIDAVVIRLRDPGTDPATVTESARPTILKGTAAATPTRPTGLLTNGDLVLAYLTVGGGSNSGTILAVEDARLMVVSRGGVVPRRGYDTRDGAYEGQCAFNTDTKDFQVWDGAAWTAVANVAPYSTYTPPLLSGATGSFVLGNTAVNLGTGALAQGRYKVVGKRLDLNLFFAWGSAPYNGGTGFIGSRLPAGMVARPNGDIQLGIAQLFMPPATVFAGVSFVRQNANAVWMTFNRDLTDNRQDFYRMGTSGNAGDIVPNQGNGALPQGGNLQVSITLEIA